jgi:uncharacterized surface protein with fasciclin (FAS1) repeats
MKTLKTVFFALMIIFGASAVKAQSVVYVGGEAMYPQKDIVSNAVNSKDHTTLVAAVKAAGLVETLQGSGPFTVFAPVNSAFDKLPAGTVETLLKPENKALLTKILTYHVVSGKLGVDELKKKVAQGKGTAELSTVSGGKIWIKENGKSNFMITDENGNSANIIISDVNQSNGVIHVIDAVVTPKS